MSVLRSLTREISPPLRQAWTSNHASADVHDGDEVTPSLAAVEAGEAEVRDHLTYFSEHLRDAARPFDHETPRLSVEAFADLYLRNQHANGRHFVIHQHNHPVAGCHYDLRLQFSASSSISFSIPYGLPGNPNSRRPGRMAIETRVHNVWNHLIESASHATGSLLIWDTGEYSIVSGSSSIPTRGTDDELSDSSTSRVSHPNANGAMSENQKLITAFQKKSMHICLHGTRLPRNYTVSMRMTDDDRGKAKQPKRPIRKRRKAATARTDIDLDTTQSEDDLPSRKSSIDTTEGDMLVATASDGEDQTADGDEQIRLNNAYPGATNSIGSIHQRKWFLRLDRRNSGVVKGRTGSDRGRWIADPKIKSNGFEPFFVCGADSEKSVVTGRTSAEVFKMRA